MRVLVCNLDPGWGFTDWTWRHGIDLYGDPRVLLWDASGGIAEASPLAWPVSIPPERFESRLSELSNLADEPSIVILLAGLAESLNEKTITETALKFSDNTLRVLMTADSKLQPETDPASLLNAFHYLFVSAASDNRERYYLFRALLEILITESQDLLPLKPGRMQPTVLRVRFGRSASPPGDLVMQTWPDHASALLRFCEKMLSEGGDRTRLDTAETAARLSIDRAQQLLEDTAPEGPKNTLLEFPQFESPFFYLRDLPPKIDRRQQSFYEDLRNYLRDWYGKLQSEHDDLIDELAHPGDEAMEALERDIGGLRLELNRDALRWLNATRHQVEDELIPRVHHNLEESITEMRGGHYSRFLSRGNGENLPSNHRNFVMPRFREDEQVERAGELAKQAARRLASPFWFLSGIAVVLGIGILPLLARALGGDENFHPFDLAWTGIVAGVFLFSQLLFAGLRQRHFRKSLKDLTVAMRQTIERHKKGVQASYRYIKGREALRRFHRLDEMCGQSIRDLQSEIAVVENLRRFLKEQFEYYDSIGVCTNSESSVSGLLEERFPSEWFAVVLTNYCATACADSTLIDVKDSRFPMRRGMESHYLTDVNVIEIEVLEPTSWD